MDKARKKPHPIIRVVATLCGIYLIYSIGSSTMDRYTVTKLTEQMKTACVGRFLVDLPASMEHSYGQVFVDGLWISAQEETQEAFDARVRARQEEIEAGPNALGQKNLEKLEDYNNNDFIGKIFTYGRNITQGLEHGKPKEWIDVKLEAYVHSKGKSFNFRADGYDPRLTGDLRKLMDKLRLLAPNEIPATPGFCFGLGMFVDPLPAELTEGVVMFAGFRDHPDLALALHTRAGLEPDKEGRLARNDRVDAEMPLWQKPLLTKIRKGKRTINGLDGEEVLESGRELNFVNVHAFDWEVNGTRNDVFVPFMHLEMSTGHPIHAGAKPVISFLGEDALVQLWDRISSSIRVRPTSSEPVAKHPQASGPQPGDSARAGDICPGTGWWECSEGANGARVADGARQFLNKGQRMPQALLLRPQTLWQRLRGTCSTVQSERPTAWVLVDRRIRARSGEGPAPGAAPEPGGDRAVS